MKATKTLVITGHPTKNSFSSALAQHYCEGAKESGKEVRAIHVGDLDFAPFLQNGYSDEQVIEPDIHYAQEDIRWADHLVFVYPTWWSTPTSLLKAFIERALTPGFAFKYYTKGKKGVAWDSYLTGKSARVISTMDGPPWYYRWVTGDPGYKMMKDTLGFCGVKPLARTYFGSVKTSTEEKRQQWLKQCRKIGKKD
jgi:putative NADPH-quinone reductase